jgi:hypothetical protein
MGKNWVTVAVAFGLPFALAGQQPELPKPATSANVNFHSDEVRSVVGQKLQGLETEINRLEKTEELSVSEAQTARQRAASMRSLLGMGGSDSLLLSRLQDFVEKETKAGLRAGWQEVLNAALAERKVVLDQQKAAVAEQKKSFEAKRTLLKRAAEACMDAKSEADLQPVLQELEAALPTEVPPRVESGMDMGSLMEQQTQLAHAVSFVKAWKHLLANEAAGKEEEAMRDLDWLMRPGADNAGLALQPSLFGNKRQRLQEQKNARVQKALNRADRELPDAKLEVAAAIAKELDELVKDNPPPRGLTESSLTSAAKLAAAWARALRAEADGNPVGVLESLRAYETYSPYELHPVPQQIIQRKYAENWKLVTEPGEAALRDFASSLRAAHDRKAVDELAAKFQAPLGKMRRLGAGGPDVEVLTGRLNRALSIITLWRKMLDFEEEQNWTEALKALDVIQQQEEAATAGTGLLPNDFVKEKRREFQQHVLAEVNKSSGPDDLNATLRRMISEKILGLEQPGDIPAVVRLIQKVVTSSDEISKADLQHLESDLQTLGASWRGGGWDGKAVAEYARSNVGHPWQTEVQTVRERILKSGIAQRFALPEILSPPNDKQTVEKSLEALADKFAQEGKWQQVYDSLSAYQQCGFRLQNGVEGNRIAQEMQAVSDFLAASNLEQAEQFPEAVHLYQNVLRCPTGRIPAKEASEHLRALKKEHPELYVPASEPAHGTAPNHPPRSNAE